MVVDRAACCGIGDWGVPPGIPVAAQITQFPPSAGAVENAEGKRTPGPFQLVRRSGRVIDSRSGADCSGGSVLTIQFQGNRDLCRKGGPRHSNSILPPHTYHLCCHVPLDRENVIRAPS